ncbi:MAG: hypothetical protein C0603_00040 [Denitrovibrio sp.]|nr:MAG: hypothetical protein C0603_00040 [Denitrovibrio sp.]
MKFNIHRSEERGHSNHGWLDSRFSFSFADYFNRNRMGFGAIRVINDDSIAPASGFPEHPHANMEIVTIVLEGTLEHKDSLGNGSVIRPGEVQRMSAGSGITHSEWNPSDSETLRLFQIWIQTRDVDISPEYDQQVVDLEVNRGRLVTLVSGEPTEEGFTFHQDAWIKRGLFSAGGKYTYKPNNGDNGILVFIVDGVIEIADNRLYSRDEITITDEDEIIINIEKDTDIILFEVPLSN